MSAAATAAWRIAVATATGAYHLGIGTGREDAYAILPPSSVTAPAGPVTVAVADGHGHARHFRSAEGAALAVSVATRVGDRLAPRLARLTKPNAVQAVLRADAGPKIVSTWRREVEADLAAHPVSAEELAAAGLDERATLDDLILGYGATLLLAVAAGPWLAFVQIGDGDLFVMAPDGAVRQPMPVDLRLDGVHTTSICQPDALSSMRYEVVDTRSMPVAAVMLATDGFGNAQAREDWEDAFGPDLVRMAAEHGLDWIALQLPAWVDQCASSEGSADDVTVALMFADGTSWKPAPVTAPRTPVDAATTIIDAPLPVAPNARRSPGDATITVPDVMAPPGWHSPSTASEAPTTPLALPVPSPPVAPVPPLAAGVPLPATPLPADGRRSAARILLALIVVVLVALAIVVYFAFFRSPSASPAPMQPTHVSRTAAPGSGSGSGPAPTNTQGPRSGSDAGSGSGSGSGDLGPSASGTSSTGAFA